MFVASSLGMLGKLKSGQTVGLWGGGRGRQVVKCRRSENFPQV